MSSHSGFMVLLKVDGLSGNTPHANDYATAANSDLLLYEARMRFCSGGATVNPEPWVVEFDHHDIHLLQFPVCLRDAVYLGCCQDV